MILKQNGHVRSELAQREHRAREAQAMHVKHVGRALPHQ